MTHLYFVTPDFSINLDPCEVDLVEQGFEPCIPRPIREHLGLLKATPAMVKAIAQEDRWHANHLAAIEAETSFERWWTAEEELPCPITKIVDDAMDRIDVMALEFEPWDIPVIPPLESLSVHSPLPIIQRELPF